MGLHPGRPDSDTLLAAQRRRWAAGDRVTVEHFLDGRPAVAGDTELVLDLIYAEVLLRREAGEQPIADEYLARFPDLADPIRAQFEVDAALEGGVTRTGGRSRSVGRPAGGPTSPAPPAPPGYEIIEELGRGGMGVVYKARQKALHRLVALKVIRFGELADPGERARFEAEARAVARLSHPNVVQIYEVGEAGGRPFLALEYVPGGSLADHLHGPPFAPRPAAALVATVAGAVQHAHDAGIVHRDLKPANILLPGVRDPESALSAAHDPVVAPDSWLLTPKLSDFGLAKDLDAVGPTQTGDFLGTPNYAAPEQAAGRADVGPAADVYGLGAILYHLVTGRPPFAGSTPLETLDQVRFAEPVPPSRLRPNLPRDLGTIVLTCLNKDPARRYPTARALAEDLTRFLAGESIRARPIGTVERAAKWARRRPAVAGLLAFVLVFAAASFATVTALWQRAATARDSEADARAKEADARAEERKERERAEARSAELLVANARYAWSTDDLDAARTALAGVPPGFRTADWKYLNRACSAARFVIAAAGGTLNEVVYSADGKLVAGVTIYGWLKVWDADTGRERLAVQVGAGGQVHSIAFGPNDRVTAAWQGVIGRPNDGRGEARVRTFDLATGRAVGEWTRPGRYGLIVLSPDGRWAALLPYERDVVHLADATTGDVRHTLAVPKGAVIVGVEFCRDGSRVATQIQGQLGQVWDTGTGQEVRRITTPASAPGMARMLFLSADGQRLAVAVHRAGKGSELVLVEGNRQVFRTDVPIPAIYRVLASADGRLVAAFGQNEVALPVWEADTGRERIILRGYGSPVRALAFRPDNRELAAGYADGRVVIWNVDP